MHPAESKSLLSFIPLRSATWPYIRDDRCRDYPPDLQGEAAARWSLRLLILVRHACRHIGAEYGFRLEPTRRAARGSRGWM